MLRGQAIQVLGKAPERCSRIMAMLQAAIFFKALSVTFNHIKEFNND